MDDRHCALCGKDHGDHLTRYFVTVDVVDDPEGEMLGGLLNEHKLYVCDRCWGKGERITTLSGCASTVLYPWIIAGAGLLIVGGVSLLILPVWKWFPIAWIIVMATLQAIYLPLQYRRFQAKLQSIAAARHDGEGPVRVFTPEQFQRYRSRRKYGDTTKSRPTLLSPRGKTVDLRDVLEPDEFAADEDDGDSTHYPEEGERSQRSGN